MVEQTQQVEQTAQAQDVVMEETPLTKQPSQEG
jgi:hypothetical protein